MTPAASAILVEFYGVARLRAGRETLDVAAGTVAEVLATVQQACPGLSELLQPDGRLAKHFMLSVNGNGFVNDVQQRLNSGDHVLLLSADAGG